MTRASESRKPRPLVRFTIRRIMIAVVVIAGILAVPAQLRIPATLFGLPCVAVIAAYWVYCQGYRRAAGAIFWGVAITANLIYAACCREPEGLVDMALIWLWFIILLPTLLGFGLAWLKLALREVEGRPQLARVQIAGYSLILMPFLTTMTLWPLHLEFLASRSALERLADRVAAGQAIAYPQQAGLFLIAGSRFDPASGNIGLMIDPDPNGPTAFIRSGTVSDKFGCHTPIRGDVLHHILSSRWCYHIED